MRKSLMQQIAENMGIKDKAKQSDRRWSSERLAKYNRTLAPEEPLVFLPKNVKVNTASERKSEYRDFINSKEWEEIKRKHKKKVCYCCGSRYSLVLHHMSYKDWRDPKGLVTICSVCHDEVHHKNGRFIPAGDRIRTQVYKIRNRNYGKTNVHAPRKKKKSH